MPRRWFAEHDPVSPINYRYAIDRVLHERRSRIQEIKVMEHSFFGRMLVLDNVVQLTERDEFLYHEMLAHVPMHSHPGPEHALVIGGGDGGTLREVLKHPTVQSATLVEIDAEVMEVARQYFPGLAGVLSAPKVKMVVADGAAFLARTKQKFDVILVDGPDPVGPARTLTTMEFYTAARQALAENGVFAMQTESLHFHLPFVTEVQKTLSTVFAWVGLYAAPLATYAGNWWTFSIAARRPLSTEPVRPAVPGTVYYGQHVHSRSYLPPDVLSRLARHQEAFDRARQTR